MSTGHEDLLKAIRDALADVGDLDAGQVLLRVAVTRRAVGMALDGFESPDFAARVLRDMVAKDAARRPHEQLMATVAEIEAERGAS